MNENYLTSKQVATKLQVTPKTLKNWRDKGILSAHKVGRAVRYKESEINKAFSNDKASN